MVEGPKNSPDGESRSSGHTTSRSGMFGGRRSLRSPGDALQPDLAPPPPPNLPRRRSPIIATASGILSFIGIAAVAAIAMFSLALQRISAPGPLTADKVVYIEAGTDSAGIVDELEHEGVIDSWPLMTGTLYLKGDRKRIKAGEYLFKQNASVDDVIDTLVSGKQILHSVTIPEGLTSEQIVDRLKDNDILVGDVRTVPREGTLMPDTYKFARGTKRDQIIVSMQQEQKRIISEVWPHRAPDTPIKSPFEMLTLASIVEKETGRADERPRVAGVFVNRLTKNMPLQSDPTIVYGLVGGKGTLGRGILRSELDQKTPYNTYAISGLPPGPICNPGKAAMEAVANPSRTKDIYFVADGTGGHAFAETLDQHKANVTRWRQIEKEAKDKLPPDADKLLQTMPPGTAPAKQNQRGDLRPAVPVYGALSTRLQPAPSAEAVPQPSSPSVKNFSLDDYPRLLAAEDQARERLKSMLPTQSAAVTPPGESDGLEAIPGIQPQTDDPGPLSAEERGIDQAGGSGSLVTFPVSPARRADEKAQAAQYGLPAGAGKLPPQEELISTDPAAAATRGPQTPRGKGSVTDASEGTAIDPLLDKNYDLNSAKTIPTIVTTLPMPRSTVSR